MNDILSQIQQFTMGDILSRLQKLEDETTVLKNELQKERDLNYALQLQISDINEKFEKECDKNQTLQNQMDIMSNKMGQLDKEINQYEENTEIIYENKYIYQIEKENANIKIQYNNHVSQNIVNGDIIFFPSPGRRFARIGLTLYHCDGFNSFFGAYLASNVDKIYNLTQVDKKYGYVSLYNKYYIISDPEYTQTNPYKTKCIFTNKIFESKGIKFFISNEL